MVAKVVIGMNKNDYDKKVIRTIISLSIMYGYNEISLDRFKEVMYSKLKNSELTTHEILEGFDRLTPEEKIDTIKECGVKEESSNLVNDWESLENSKTKMFKSVEILDNKDLIDRPPRDIKRQLKYCKNPLERKALNKELSYANKSNGKHKNSKKKHKK